MFVIFLFLQLFLDLNQENVIKTDAINRGNLIGRGAFGFVFKAILNPSDANKEPRAIAMKMLQPVQPGIRTRKVKFSSKNSYSIHNSNM